MSTKNIWLDCDPGIDDALAILLLGADQQKTNLLGLSVSSGNLPMETVKNNALRLSSLAGLYDVPVVTGSTAPLFGKAHPAGDVHGSDGLGGYIPPKTEKTAIEDNGLLYCRNTLMSLGEDETCDLLLTAPMTNAALLLKTFPEVKEKIHQIIFMGGSLSGGNTTPYAEFNIYHDPEAAKIVLNSGIPCTMIGLDLTLKNGITRDQLAHMKEKPGGLHQGAAKMLEHYGQAPSNIGKERVPIHDALVAACAMEPELFSGHTVKVGVDCSQGQKRGQTYQSEQGAEIHFLDSMNLPAFMDLFENSLNRLEENLG